MSSLSWVRLWTDIEDDPKIISLSDSAYRTFIQCLTWAGKKNNSGKTDITLENIDLLFRRKARKNIEVLMKNELITLSSDGFVVVVNWTKRQPKSDHNGAERVRKSRNKKDNNGNGGDYENNNSNSDVTLQDSYSNALEKRERRTDTEKNRTERECVTVSPEQFQWATDWLKQNKLDGVVCLSLVADKFVNYWSARDKPPKDLAAKWRQWVMNETPGKPGKTPTAEVIPMQQKDYQAGATKLEDMPDWMRQAASELVQ